MVEYGAAWSSAAAKERSPRSAQSESGGAFGSRPAPAKHICQRVVHCLPPRSALQLSQRSRHHRPPHVRHRLPRLSLGGKISGRPAETEDHAPLCLEFVPENCKG